MTATGLVLIPLALVIILLPWRYSCAALLIFATLDSAAVVNVGSFGLQPGYFFGLLIIARTVVEIVVLNTALNAQVIRMLMPMFWFIIICFISIWVGLTFFQGKVMVISSTAGFNLDLAQPYTFQRQNLTQPFYLLLNVGIVYALAHQIARLPPDLVAVTLDRAVLGAIVFASLIAIWEMANFYFGVPFFPAFFHSNAGYYAAHGQMLGRVLRVSGASAEPSGLAYQFAAFLMYAWYRYLGKPSTGAMGVVVLCVTITAASTSTTGFMMLGIFALLVAKDLIVMLATPRAQVMGSMHHLGVTVLIASAALGAYVFIQSHWHDIDGVLTSILFEKHQSSSFAQRSGADLIAIDIVMQTGGIGIGIGSHKPNNLAMTLVSNTGIAGTLLFGLFLFELLRPRRASSIVDLRPYRWMVIGLLSVHLISNPNLNPIILWIGFALIIGALSAERQAVGESAASRNIGPSPSRLTPSPPPMPNFVRSPGYVSQWHASTQGRGGRW